MINPKNYQFITRLSNVSFSYLARIHYHVTLKKWQEKALLRKLNITRGVTTYKSTIIYYDLIIPVILHRSVGGSKVSLSEKIPQ